MRLAILVIITLISSAHAEESKIYRTLDENGNPVFTDIPPRNFTKTKTEVSVNPANTYQSESSRPAYEPGLPAGSGLLAEAVAYQVLNISSPDNDASFRDNAGNVRIEGHVQPELRAGDQLRLVLDGVMTEVAATGLNFELANVDRGSHRVQLVIIDAEGSQLISSKTSTFHLQRYAKPQAKAPAGS